MLHLRVTGFVVSVSSLLLLAPPVSAQANASSQAAAEALFDQGVKQMKAGNFTEGCPTLEESERVDPAVGTLLYLGECYEKLGRTASAWATFRDAASLAATSGESGREKVAGERAARLEPRLAYVKLSFGSESIKLTGFSVKLGSALLHLSLAGVTTPVDPGPQAIEVSAPGYESFSVTLNVETSKRYEVVVPELRALAPPIERSAPPPLQTATDTPPAPAAPSTPPVESKPSHPYKRVGLVVGAVGVLGIGIGSYFGIRAISKNNQATDGSCSAGFCLTSSDLDLASQAKDAARASNVAFAVGGAALVAGAVLYVFAPHAHEAAVTFTPYASPREAGVALRGRL